MRPILDLKIPLKVPLPPLSYIYIDLTNFVVVEPERNRNTTCG